MNQHTRLSAALFALACLGAPGPAASAPEPFVAEYDVRFAGLRGEATMTLAEEAADDRMSFESRTRARGIARLARPNDAVERSVFKLDGGSYRPIHFESQDGSRSNKDGNVIEFDWEEDRALSTHEGTVIEKELEAGVLDRQLMQLVMMQDLAAGVEQADYTVIDGDQLKVYRSKVIGTERVEVPAGTFETTKVERARPGSSRSSLLWCAPQLDYLPVRLQQLKEGKARITMELVSFRQGSGAAAEAR